ncbi:MAG: hypothetical protein ACLUJE_01555 [Anaerococcus sp.]
MPNHSCLTAKLTIIFTVTEMMSLKK